MKLSQRTGTAIQIAIMLATKGRMTSAELAAALDLSPDYCGKVGKGLTHAGLVVTYRGCRGGFELAKRPRGISLLEIIESTEGRIQVYPAGMTTSNPSWRALNKAKAMLRAELRAVTLEGLADEDN